MAKEPAPAPPELIAEMRDYALEVYLRRLPEAAPEPGTLYAIIEASAVVWASVVFNSENAAVILDGLRELVAADREETVAPPPHPDEDFYKPLKDREGKTLRTHADLPPPGSAPNTGCAL